jgi:hypothetical protein
MVKIKFICVAVLWFDRVNGNTNHSVRIMSTKTGRSYCAEMRYGYGNHYKQTAIELLAYEKLIPMRYRKENKWRYESENNYPIYWTVQYSTKKECVANGKL